MGTAHAIGWGLAGATVTKLTRTATRKALHEPSGAPRLPRAARRNNGFAMMLLLAAAAGAILALGDVIQERRREVARA